MLLVAAGAVGAGLAVAFVQTFPAILLTYIAFVGAVGAVAATRSTVAPDFPRAQALAPLIAWGGVVLLPWTYFWLHGPWVRVQTQIDPALAASWHYHVLALAGLTAGIISSLVLGRRRWPQTEQPTVNWQRVSLYIGAAVGLYLVSFLVARRPLAALWRVSGRVTYAANVDQSTAFGILDVMTVAGVTVLLVATAARRMRRYLPTRAEVVWLVLLGILTLGSGVRARLYFLGLGWLILQFGPLMAVGRSGVKKTMLIVSVAAVAVVGLSVAGSLSESRARVNLHASTTRVAIQGTDVIGPAEILFERDGAPGMLAGQSYKELPRELLPKRVVGKDKPAPAADLQMRRLDRTAGYSAPLWIEAVLNYGAKGALAFGFAYGAAATWLRRRMRADPHRLARTFALLGPVWVLVDYMVLSRLTALQLISTGGMILFGGWLVARCLLWDAAATPEVDAELASRSRHS